MSLLLYSVPQEEGDDDLTFKMVLVVNMDLAMGVGKVILLGLLRDVWDICLFLQTIDDSSDAPELEILVPKLREKNVKVFCIKNVVFECYSSYVFCYFTNSVLSFKFASCQDFSVFSIN